MSENNSNFDSNGVRDYNTDSQDVPMALPTQSSPMGGSGAGQTNSNFNSNSNHNSTSHNSNTNSSKTTNNTESQPILSKPRLLELVREVDATAQLDEDVEELLLQIADDFVEDAIKSTCAYAKHRKVSKVEVRDVQLHLERKWNMWIPGFGTDEVRPYKRASVTEAHKQRLALIRKTIKKY
ncbi:transcription initiation factor TFIID subunit 12-like [Eupeodes corollae]|uniref:transcription initiation factor TFIID subunit 12-like n=1 Tax=Eupeodes corollae TaxID=290404 RepID=UPI00249019E5|nr:transcription initiation factor TFIID subunit 12-like [Eupeodes corollae]